MCGKLRSGSEHRSLIERLAYNGGIDVSPHHQAKGSASDQNGIADSAEHPVKVKPRADLLRLRFPQLSCAVWSDWGCADGESLFDPTCVGDAA
jgi:hypothetical protein